MCDGEVETWLRKVNKFWDFMLDEHQASDIVKVMIIEEIRRQIEKNGKSRYQISKETGIDEGALCRIMQGGSCKVETADALFEYFGIRLVARRRKSMS